ncbi:exodeoxyribonuclease III [Thermovibrio ammonificans]
MRSLVTWNVNSVRARLNYISYWLERERWDFLALQETKVPDELFPEGVFKELGYGVVYHGQKAYNGVALCFKGEPLRVLKGWPDGEDDEKRLITVWLEPFPIVNVYVPRGGEKGSERHAFKLYFLTKLKLLLQESFSPDEPLAVVGDFNVARSELDVYDPAVWRGRPGFMEDERQAFEELLSFGLFDLFRELHPDEPGYTWWDIETGGFARNRGLRIDYILVTEPLLKRAQECRVLREARRKLGGLLPSDHAPLVAAFRI